jgi:hypothetical protein
MVEKRTTCRAFFGKHKEPLRRYRCRREDNPELDLKYDGLVWLRVGTVGALL